MRTLLYGLFVVGAILIAGCNDLPLVDTGSDAVSLEKSTQSPCPTCPGILVLDAAVVLGYMEIGGQEVVEMGHVSGDVKFTVAPSQILSGSYVNVGTTLDASVERAGLTDSPWMFTGSSQDEVAVLAGGTGSLVKSYSASTPGSTELILNIQYTVTHSTISVNHIWVSGPADSFH